MGWTIEYYTDIQGNSPVEVFLQRLPEKNEAKIVWTLRTLRKEIETAKRRMADYLSRHDERSE